jgi:hypothetical protein
MESKPSELITVRRSRKLARRRFLGGSDARIITSTDEAPVMRRLWHEQNIQCLGITTGDPPRTRAHVAKSSTAQTPRLRLIGRQQSRRGHRQQQNAENFTAFMTAIRRFMKAYAILWRKLYARFSEHTVDQGNRVPVSRVATDLDIRDRVSMKTGRLKPSPEPSNSAQHAPSRICAIVTGTNCANVTCDKVTAMIIMSSNQRGIQ